MNTKINKASINFIGYINKNPVCFFSVLHFPHPHIKNFKKGHRLVVLPDYQGLGIGHLFSSEIAQYFVNKNFRFIITSSTKALFTQRNNDKRWKVTRKGRVGLGSKLSTLHNRSKKNLFSANKLTYSYEFVEKPNKT